ncbi:hypothetical protein PanWU01x14_285280 [Parasponia andersonii]|uniref:Uncharacterized protein n=1 Tax=Parasponia andersonii TaxID=3476 RepID=A0A2P5AZS9_PARAD|nr:hypothetical protein PanWU01x14_285280 [Parasponia andersonii]
MGILESQVSTTQRQTPSHLQLASRRSNRLIRHMFPEVATISDLYLSHSFRPSSPEAKRVESQPAAVVESTCQTCHPASLLLQLSFPCTFPRGA